jgi:predicted dehydrogenase
VIRLGLIGLGEQWETRDLPALRRLVGRVEIAVVFDPIAARAQAVAAELDARHVDGILATSRRHDVDALLVTDLGPGGLATIRLAASTGKPTLVTGSFVEDAEQLATLALAARSAGNVLMPGLALRYAPATARLRELSATSLGRPRTILVRDPGVARAGRFAELVDWCRYVSQSSPRSVRTEPINGRPPTDLSTCRIQLEFDPGTSRRHPVVATIECRSDPGEPQSEIVCEHGTAEIAFPHTLVWKGREGAARTESLDEERPDFDVMLDQFLRRVVGGLVPVPDYDDVCHGLRVGAAAGESLRCRGPVDLS